MKFKVADYTPPKDGTVRYRDMFCWLPFEVNGYNYWLESISVKEKYQTATCEGAYTGWVACEVIRFN